MTGFKGKNVSKRRNSICIPENPLLCECLRNFIQVILKINKVAHKNQKYARFLNNCNMVMSFIFIPDILAIIKDSKTGDEKMVIISAS